MKLITFLFCFLLVACQHNGYDQRYSYNGCIPPTYQRAQQRVGFFPAIISALDAGLYGHLDNHRPLHDGLVRKALYDLQMEYMACQRQQLINQRQKLIMQSYETDRRVEKLIRDTQRGL